MTFIGRYIICGILLLTTLATQAKTIRVGSGGGAATLTQALQHSQPGDTIVVGPGTYTEGQLEVNHPRVVILGQGNPVLDGNFENEILTITADSVVVKNLTFKNVAATHLKDNAAIRLVNVRGCTVSGNFILNSFFGIYLEGVQFCNIEYNTVKSNAVRETTSGNAIHGWNSKEVVISGNTVSGHRDGIYLEFVENSRIVNNISRKNLRYGLHFMFSNGNSYEHNYFSENGAGVAVMYSRKINMHQNTFEKNTGAAAYGILLKDIVDSEIRENIFDGNTIGIFAEGSNRLKFQHNTFRQNGWAVKIMGSCDELHFDENNFLANTFEISTSSSRTATYYFQNNYWSRYSGYDLNRDGIGDVPHRPVKLFSYLIERVPSAVVLIESMFIDLLELAEKVTPSLTPADLEDPAPKMKPNVW